MTRATLCFSLICFVVGGLLVAPLAAQCCMGYCACTDWQTGNGYAGCEVRYGADDNITGVTCAYSGGHLKNPN